jgi:hypothetical protein
VIAGAPAASPAPAPAWMSVETTGATGFTTPLSGSHGPSAGA